MPNLRELQEELQNYVLQKDVAIENEIVAPSDMPAERRLHIYRNAYYLRLIEILENDFFVLHKIMGPKPFNGMMRDYIDAYPSHHYSVRWVGKHLGKFLKNKPGCHPAYSELAEFEWALNKALFSSLESVLELTDLANIPPESWGDLQLKLHPSVQLLSCSYNTSERWRSVHEEDQDIDIVRLDHPQHHVIWCKDNEAYFLIISEEQNRLLSAIRKGESFGTLCESMLEFFPEETVVQWVANTLHLWVTEKIFSK